MADINDIFNLYSDDVRAYLGENKVCSLSANKDRTVMICHVEFEDIVDRKVLYGVQNKIQETYSFSRFNICPKYRLTEINDKYIDNLKQYILLKYPSACGFLKDSVVSIEEDRVVFELCSVASSYLSVPIKQLCDVIYTETGLRYTVTYKSSDGHSDDEFYSARDIELKDALQKSCCDITDNTINKQSVRNEQASNNTSISTYKRSSKKAMELKKGENIIWGKLSEDKIVPMDSLGDEIGRVTVKGDVFLVDHREIRNKNLMVISFDVTDYFNSIRVTKVIDINKAQVFIDEIHTGDTLIVQGEIAYNNFERENIMNPVGIARSSKEIRKDEAHEKRVELHLHTNMSSMDGISDIDSLVRRAKEWGHRAIAVTDHGVAQAFPDAMKAAKKHGIKLIYGIEAYYVNDSNNLKVVTGIKDCELDDTFIVFDIETTGLKVSKEHITEIAAIKVKNMRIIDSFQTYVNPHKPVPAYITELTGITDEMVKDAPDVGSALKEFTEFCGDSVLVAHNANFDISFINKFCSDCGISWDITYIDTLEMSRILLPHLTKHKLNNLAKEMKVGKFDHHKASEDAKILSYIFIKFLQIMKDKHGAKRVSDINFLLLSLKKDSAGIKSLRSHHLTILVKDLTGLKNLYKLISKAHLQYYYKRPVMPRSEIEKHREGLILGSACESGELFKAVVDEKSQKELEKIAKFYDFLEIQPVGNNMFMVYQNLVDSVEMLRLFNKKIVDLGETLNKPVVATGDVHFLEPSDEVFRRILMSGVGFSDADNQAPLYFKTTNEMLDEFSYLGKEKAYEVVIKNTNAISDMCKDILPVPKETYVPKIEGSSEELRFLCESRAIELYGKNIPDIVRKRLDKELNSIIYNGFDVMYMIAQKLVSKSMEDGYLVGSRGSVGSSLVAFLSGITEVNALPAHYRCPVCKNCEFFESTDFNCGVDMPDASCPKCGNQYQKDGFDIPFETFLGFDGDKAPDIDLNFSGEYQAKAHKYTGVLFGEDHVFRAGTIGTIASKTAYGFVKKYLEEKEITASKAEQNRLTYGCTGIKRTTGQHPGGVMVVPKENEIYEFCPVQHPADDPDSDIITTHFDYHSIHNNLLKLDLLGHDDPTVIKHLEDLTGINAREIPLDDKDTMRIFTSTAPLNIDSDDILDGTGSVAVPEFGTKFVRGMLNDTKPTTFDELLRISGLSHGTDVWLGNAQDLIANNVATLKNCICCRDDIMNFLISMNVDPKLSFTIMESVRKGRGLNQEWEDEMKKNNVPQWYIDSCKKIKYMFPKAHAVAYVMMAFRIAWFKVHKPLAFYSAYFSIRAKGFDAQCMIFGDDIVIQKMKELNEKDKSKIITSAEKEMLITLEVCHEFYKRGFKFHPINIYTSHQTNFLIRDDGLIPPFTSIPGLGDTAALSIVDERQNGKFISNEDLIIRCDKVSNAVIELLAAAGALKDMPTSNQVSLF